LAAALPALFPADFAPDFAAPFFAAPFLAVDLALPADFFEVAIACLSPEGGWFPSAARNGWESRLKVSVPYGEAIPEP
jgi:hypothetical protein